MGFIRWTPRTDCRGIRNHVERARRASHPPLLQFRRKEIRHFPTRYHDARNPRKIRSPRFRPSFDIDFFEIRRQAAPNPSVKLGPPDDLRKRRISGTKSPPRKFDFPRLKNMSRPRVAMSRMEATARYPPSINVRAADAKSALGADANACLPVRTMRISRAILVPIWS